MREGYGNYVKSKNTMLRYFTFLALAALLSFLSVASKFYPRLNLMLSHQNSGQWKLHRLWRHFTGALCIKFYWSHLRIGYIGLGLGLSEIARSLNKSCNIGTYITKYCCSVTVLYRPYFNDIQKLRKELNA